MKCNKPFKCITVCIILLCYINLLHAENIDPYDSNSQYAYGENVGWLNFEPNTGDGAQVASDKLTGWVWAENIGWISLSCENTSSCGTVNYGVTINTDGVFDGYAWTENIGWINFGIVNNYVVTCKITFEDLANFVNYWLDNGTNPADLDGEADNVDFEDYAIFSGYWQDFCPDGWQLE